MPLADWASVDRSDPGYKACLLLAGGGGALVGGALGSFLGPAGTVSGYLGGAAWGLTAGYLACPYLVPPLKKKLKEGLPMTEAEVRSAAEVLGNYASLKKASDAIDLLGIVRMHATRDGSAPLCQTPVIVARQIISA
jgi:hypothetical protein